MNPIEVLCLPYGGSANPYQDLLAKSLKAEQVTVENFTTGWKGLIRLSVIGKLPDCIHIHWPDSFVFVTGDFAGQQILSILKGMISNLCFLSLRLRGVRLVYTLHNLRNHENRNPLAERLFLFCFLKVVHGIIAHCCEARQMLGDSYGHGIKKKTDVIAHGNYINSHKRIDRRTARESLGLSQDQQVFVFLGNIRPYKGVPELIDAFDRASSQKDAKLIVAGRVISPQLEDSLQTLAADNERIDLKLGYASDEDLALILSAANAFVVPFSNVLTSGSVILAMSMGLACIVPKIGCLPELLNDTQNLNLLYDPSDNLGLFKSLEFSLANTNELDDSGRKNLVYAQEHLAWEHVAKKTRAIYIGRMKSTAIE